MPKQQPWWNGAVIYQLIVRSYADGNGDGIGDLQGLASRLPYLRWLGVEAIWLTPVYPSPLQDGGYDSPISKRFILIWEIWRPFIGFSPQPMGMV